MFKLRAALPRGRAAAARAVTYRGATLKAKTREETVGTGDSAVGTGAAGQDTRPPPPAEEALQTDKLMMSSAPALEQIPAERITQQPEPELKPELQPLAAVPGPLFMKVLNSLWQYLPVVGTQLAATIINYVNDLCRAAGTRVKWASNIKPYNYLFDEYGPVVRMHGPFGGDMVMINHPEDIRAVCLREPSPGVGQTGAVLDSVEAYRQVMPHVRVPMVRPDVTKLKAMFKDQLTHRTEDFRESMIKIAVALVNRMGSIRTSQGELPDWFINDLYSWSFDCVSKTVFNRRNGLEEMISLTDNGRESVISSLSAASQAISTCESGLQLWRLFPTPAWNKLTAACDTVDGHLCRNIRMAYMRLDKIVKSGVWEGDNLAFIESMIIREDIAPEQLITKLLDVFLIGVNTAVNTTGFLMYNLAKNPKVQKTLHGEISKVMPIAEASPVSVANMPYLNACITETLRLNPPFPYVRRLLTADTVIHGFTIPRGTYVVMANEVAFSKEDVFEEAWKFRPERWTDASDPPEIDPLDVMPYCSTYPKQLLYQQIAVLLAKVIQKYKLEYNYGPIRSGGRLLAVPNRPFKFRLIDRPQL